MKRLLPLLCASALLLGCSREEPAPEPVRPVLSFRVAPQAEESLGRFAGTIQARYETNLGFRVPGRIANRNVDVGAEVGPGDLLATLDPPTSRTSCGPPRATWPRSRRSGSTPRPMPGASRNCSTAAWAPRRNWTSPRPT